jgi:hypothetical protein
VEYFEHVKSKKESLRNPLFFDPFVFFREPITDNTFHLAPIALSIFPVQTQRAITLKTGQESGMTETD